MTRFLLFLMFLFPAILKAQYVIDGDTFVYNNVKIRLVNVDSPERNCAGAEESKQQLKKLLKGKITYKVNKVDKYGRYICTVYCNGKDVSYEMVRTGYSTVYRRYCRNINYLEAEAYAKRRKLGIWKYTIINPENYRHRK